MGKEESIKKWGNYSQSKFYLRKNLWLLTKRSKVVRTKDVHYERMDYWTIKVFKKTLSAIMQETRKGNKTYKIKEGVRNLCEKNRLLYEIVVATSI